MSEKKKIFKPQPVSGFPEWLPEVRAVELQWFDHIRRIFESYGFCNIETPSVELLDALKAKGGDGEADVDKEIYVLERYHKEEGDKEARLALHFDQTVPLARYTAQHFNDLVFPFKRYQMQRVWRGERPQAGRFREFYQCDIDVINVDSLPLHFDAEMPAIIWEVLSSLPGMEKEKIQIRINNRKILSGLLEPYGATTQDQQAAIFRIIDKKAKLSPDVFENELSSALESYSYNGVKALGDVKSVLAYQELLSEMSTSDQIGFIRELITALNETKWIEFEKKYGLNKIHYFYHDFGQGFVELYDILNQLSHLPSSAVVADLSIVRGLDYYTGTVYETVFLDDPGYGSICSGGRYDDLAGNYINKHLPGVGISIGFSRLFDRLRQQGYLPAGRLSPADIMVVMPSEERRALTMETAQKLRKNGWKVETFHNPVKLAKQYSYAEKKGIPYVWKPPSEENERHTIKNMLSQETSEADPDDWKKD